MKDVRRDNHRHNGKPLKLHPPAPTEESPKAPPIPFVVGPPDPWPPGPGLDPATTAPVSPKKKE